MEDNTHWHLAEPTISSGYSNPYEPTVPSDFPNPYEREAGIPPPPPRKPRRPPLALVLVIAFALLLIASVGLFTLLRSSALSTTQPTPILKVVLVTPTAQATTTQASQGRGAVDIYNNVAHRLDATTHHIVLVGFDTDWQGWPYAPERQAFVWHDNGTLYEIAAYSSSSEASADAGYNASLQGLKYQTNVIGSCLFLYDRGANDVITADYLPLLANQPGCASS